MSLITDKEFVRMFEFTRIPPLMAEVFLSGYQDVEVFLMFDGEWWSSYISNESLQRTNIEGYKLFGAKEDIESFKQSFYDYRSKASIRFEDISSSEIVTAEMFTEFMELWKEMYHYYRRTEFFYVDGVFGNADQTIEQKELAEDFGRFKFEAREMLNEIWFGGRQWYLRLGKMLSKKLNLSEDDIAYLKIDEIVDLLNNPSIDSPDISERKKAYTMYNKGGSIKFEYGNEALIEISHFRSRVEKGALIGNVANKGYAKGKAKILIFDSSKPDLISKIISETETGDILCAETTSPEWMPACKKAGALVTAQGGLLSHAAIVSRELNIPCIVGVSNILKVVKDGDMIEVDANKGIVKILS